MGQGSSAAIVVPACGNLDLGVGDPVDQPMLLSDTPGPVAGELVSQRLRFAQPLVSVASDVPDQGVDLLPYNGDLRGSTFHGSYTVDAVTVERLNDVAGSYVKY